MFNSKIVELVKKHNLDLIQTNDVKCCGIDLNQGVIFYNEDFMTSNEDIADSSLLHELGHYLDAASMISIKYFYALYTKDVYNMVKREEKANTIAEKLGAKLGIQVNKDFFKSNIRGYVLRGQEKLDRMTRK